MHQTESMTPGRMRRGRFAADVAAPRAAFAALSVGLLLGAGLLQGCSKDAGGDPTITGAQPAPRRTTQQAAETIKNDPNMKQEDKDKYLRQLKENEMAERMNPNAAAQPATPPPPGR